MPTALITGASAGLGAEFARQLAAQQHDLILVARREDRLRSLADSLESAHGVSVSVLSADLSDVAAPQKLVEGVQALGRSVDVLINNAGAAGPDFLTERDWSAHRRYGELMMTSCVALCHAFLPGMRERGFGRILNVSSVAGRVARGGDLSYGPAKAYLVAVSEALHATFVGENIHTTALCPGFTHTDFHAEAELLAMKEKTPKFIWYDAETVVREGLAALEKGKPIYVSGRLYRWLDPLMQSVITRRLFRISR